MLVRLLIALALVVAVIIFARRLRWRVDAGTRRVIGARTVRCAHCQVYLPRAEAVERDGLSFCSRAHADAGRARP